MVCIYCGSETRVSNSRAQRKTNAVWRRRACDNCQATVTTLEKLDLGSALVVTDKRRHEAFSRDKLLISIHDSLKHRKTALADAMALTETIISHLTPHIVDAALTKELIIAETSKTLARFDKAAGVQYAAYHANQWL